MLQISSPPVFVTVWEQIDMNYFPCHRLFIISGLFHAKCDPKHQRFKISKLFLVYGIFLTISIQFYNVYEIINRLESIGSLLYDGSRHELMGKIIITLDHFFWMILNWSHPLIVLLKRHKISDYLNGLSECEKNLLQWNSKAQCDSNNKIIRTWIIFCLFLFTVGIPFGFVMSDITSFSKILSGYAFTFGFIIGHLYEFVFFEKVRHNYSFLRSSFNINDGHKRLWDWISSEAQLMKLSKLNASIFAVSKIALLLSANMLISVYWFYNYDLKTRITGSIVWQSFISVIFILCHIWDRLSNEVSFIC